jgi:chromosome partitioning protein
MRKITCIANQKGGVSKTTTAINLSASLAAAEKKTLLIDLDCDPQGNSSNGIGIDRSLTGNKNPYQVLINKIPIKEAITNTQISTLDIIFSNENLIGVDIGFVSLRDREKRLKNMPMNLNTSHEFIIIDCPLSLSFLTLNSLVASDMKLAKEILSNGRI